MSQRNKIFIQEIALIFGIFILASIAIPLVVFGQTPTTTVTPNTGNLKFQEQKAFIVIPPDQIPAQYQQQLQAQQPGAISNDDIMKFVAGMAGGSLTGLWARFKGIMDKKQIAEKTENIEQIQREHSVQIVKGAEVDEKIATQVYENMEDKGAKINDKPGIQLKTLVDNKTEAATTAAKVGK
jgi:hypothetical protein